MKYRPVRGSLDTSMKECVEVSGVRDIFTILNARIGPPVRLEEIEVKPYGFDKRINWDTHIVTVSGAAVGFTDGPCENCERG